MLRIFLVLAILGVPSSAASLPAAGDAAPVNGPAAGARREHPADGSGDKAAADDDDEEEDDEDDEEEDDGDTGKAVDASGPGKIAAATGRPDDAAGSFSAGGSLDAVSRYVWRGIALSRRPAVEPEVWASLRSFTASLWANGLITSEPESRRLSSAEAEISYKLSWAGIDVEPRLTRYWFFERAETFVTTEAGVGLERAFGPWAVVSAHQVDVETDPGAYFGTLGGRVRHARDDWEGTIAAGVAWASARFNRAHWNRDVTALELVECSAEVRYFFTSLVSVALHGALSALVPAQLRAATSEPALVSGGLVFSINQ